MINHLGIIVDGNGRWAKEKGLSRSEGHKAGANNLEQLIIYISKNKIAKYLSLYVFSTENFSRDKLEVEYLMNLFIKWFQIIKTKYSNENIQVIFSGNRSYLNKDIQIKMNSLEEATKDCDGLIVNFCLSYGGRQEIVDATKKICNNALLGKLTIDEINEELFSNYLYNKLPDIDFCIRTSGEMRLSNFMLWQISYAELYFPKVYFPDFNEECLNDALNEFKKRDRRFGKTK